jgi:hypothetical protein
MLAGYLNPALREGGEDAILVDCLHGLEGLLSQVDSVDLQLGGHLDGETILSDWNEYLLLEILGLVEHVEEPVEVLIHIQVVHQQLEQRGILLHALGLLHPLFEGASEDLRVRFL